MTSLTRRRLIARAASAAAALPLLTVAARAATHEVAIRGMAFVPADLQVALGDTVLFTNQDAAPHTATAEDGSFDTGRLRRGESVTVTPTSAGEFGYFCRLHPAMKARIVVR